MTDGPNLADAVNELTQPQPVDIDRASQLDPDVAELNREGRALSARLLSDWHTHRRAGREYAAATTLGRLVAHERREQARRGSKAWTVPLLDQVLAAVESSSAVGGGPAAPKEQRSAIGLAAHQWTSDVARHVVPDRGQSLNQAIHRWARDHLDPAAAAGLVVGWIVKARTLLDPPRKLTAVGACLVCGKRTVHVPDDTGEVVRRPALELDPRDGSARCLNPKCRTVWPPERVPLLAAALEQQNAEHEESA